MPEHKPFHTVVGWALESAQVFDWSNAGVDVSPGFFDKMLEEGMEMPDPDSMLRVGQREGVIQFKGCPVWINDCGDTGPFVVHCQGGGIYTHSLTAHQKLALAAAVEAARAEKEGKAPRPPSPTGNKPPPGRARCQTWTSCPTWKACVRSG